VRRSTLPSESGYRLSADEDPPHRAVHPVLCLCPMRLLCLVLDPCLCQKTPLPSVPRLPQLVLCPSPRPLPPGHWLSVMRLLPCLDPALCLDQGARHAQ
jgi:hypothetical protein